MIGPEIGTEVGVAVWLLGAVGLLMALVHRRALRALTRQHDHLDTRSELLDWREASIARREERLAAEARALHEWEGRLMQVAECGCAPPERPPGVRAG